MELDFQPKIVGRDEELLQLRQHLDRAMKGEGSTVLISGEGGIGKTRLVNELKSVARSKGFQVLSGCGMYESLTPYMPFMEALRSGGLDTLFSEETPKVEAAYLVTNTGLLIKEVLREKTDLDSDLFASMLTTVGEFVKDSFSMMLGEEREGFLNTLGYENFRILVESRTTANLAVIISGRESEFLVNDMRGILAQVEKQYGKDIEDWDGVEEGLEGIEGILRPLVSSGRYDGVYYGLDDPKARRNLLFENISLGLTRHAKTTPTLLCIEDLHWADPSSLALMHYVARNTKMCSLLILGTYRPEDVSPRDGKPHPLVDTMRLMDRENLYQKMELRRLSEESMSEFLIALLGKTDLRDEFKGMIYGETEGNPLFIMELVRLLIQDGVISLHDGAWMLSRGLGKVDIPPKIHDVIVRRLDRLDGEERRVLEYASVVGEVFTSTVLADALSLDRIRLLERLRALDRRHGLVHPLNGSFKFDHTKVKEVLYCEIPQELRMEYHSIVAASIEKLSKDNLEEVVGDLAFHYYRCRNKEKARIYLTKAAENAKRRYSNDEAVRFYDEALEFVVEKQRRLEILMSLGEVFELVGDHERALRSLEDAMELADDVRTRSELQVKIGRLHMKQGRYDETIAICTKALEAVEGEGCKEEALCLNELGIAQHYIGDYEKALGLIEKGLMISEKVGDQRIVARSLSAMGNMHHARGDYGRALEYHERGLMISEETGDQRGIAAFLNNIGNVHYDRGDYEKALEFFEKSLAMSERMGNQEFIVNHLNNIGNVHYDKGEYDKAIEFHQKSMAISERIGDQRGIAISLSNMGVVYHNRGEYQMALEFHGKSMAICERIGEQRGVAIALNNMGDVHHSRGDYDRALELFEKSLTICDRIEDRHALIRNYCSLAEICVKKGNLTDANEFCAKALQLSDQTRARQDVGLTKRTLGMICSEQGKWDLAVENFDGSIEIFGDLGMRPELARTHHEYGLMWKKRGDVGQARENLNKAVEIYEALKLEKRVEKVRESFNGL